MSEMMMEPGDVDLRALDVVIGFLRDQAGAHGPSLSALIKSVGARPMAADLVERLGTARLLRRPIETRRSEMKSLVADLQRGLARVDRRLERLDAAIDAHNLWAHMVSEQ